MIIKITYAELGMCILMPEFLVDLIVKITLGYETC